MAVLHEERQAANDLLRFIDASPSPWHAVHQCVDQLEAAGFRALSERDAWTLQAGDRRYVIRDDSSIIAFVVGEGLPTRAGFRVVGAHTDSPGFRVKPAAAHSRGNTTALGVEVYGGPILATFADRDLRLAGRVMLQQSDGQLSPRLFQSGGPLVRLPNPAIHLNRDVNSEGLKFDLQEELPLVLGTLRDELPPAEQFRDYLAEGLNCEPRRIASWELAVADTQPGAFFGLESEYFANSQLDNLASCHAALQALIDDTEASGFQGVSVIAFFDHEEIGSRSFKGADSSFLPDTLARISDALGQSDGNHRRALAASLILSVDMAHAHHPNYARFHDAQHQVDLNGGPVIKVNANQRYATDGGASASFQVLCNECEVPFQTYVHRNDLPCGSTIGPITAAGLGVRCADVGNAMWSMHSIRESAGTRDHLRMMRVMSRFFTRPSLPLD